MENMELLQAMRQMMEEVVSPIYELMDKMNEHLDKLDKRLEKVEILATKTQIAMENDVVPKIKLLFEENIFLHSRFAQLDEMERILREVRSDVLLLQNVVTWYSNDIRMLKRRRIGD